MNVIQLKRELRRIIREENRDAEQAHGSADNAIDEYLKCVDPEIVELNSKINKWYS